MKKFRIREAMNLGRRLFTLGLLLSFAFTSVSAHALGQREFFVNSAGLELFGGSTRMSIAPGYNLGIYEWLQVGGSLSYQSLAFADTSVNTMTFQLGPTFNLGGPYATATFIFFGLAIKKGSGEVLDPEDDPAGMGLAFLVGRRIPILGGLSYRPSAGIQLAGKTSWIFNALAVSYLF